MITSAVSIALINPPLSKKISSPIFTVNLPGQKMYVVTNADLVQKVQKQYDTVAFPPLAAAFSARTAGTSEASSQAMKRDNYALVHASNDILTDTLKPGENLDRMNRVMLGEIGRSIQALEPAHQKTVRIQFNKWLRETLTRATTRSMYGPKNPYEREGVYDAFWLVPSHLLLYQHRTDVSGQGLRRRPGCSRDRYTPIHRRQNSRSWS